MKQPNQFKEIKQLIEELLFILQKYGTSSYNPQKGIIDEMINIINSNYAEPQKDKILRFKYKQLFFPKSPLSEFYVWPDNPLEREKINTSLENIKFGLWELLG